MGIEVAHATWPEVERALAGGAIAILPIGAASKEHGRHLPMNTDMRQVQWISEQLVATRQVVVWPNLGYGYYPVFVEFPGSISVRQTHFIDLVQDIMGGIAAAGANQLVLLNTGISTIKPLERAIAAGPTGLYSELINVYHGAHFQRCSQNLAIQAFGGHADEIETSIMLAIDSECVSMENARVAPRHIARGLFKRHDEDSPNYSPDGVNGNPSLATAVKGEALLAALMADVNLRLDHMAER